MKILKLFETETWHKAQMFLILFLIFFAGLSSGYVWRMIHELEGKHPIQYVYNLPQEVLDAHNSQTKYHGLFQGQGVFEDPLGWYFIKDGKRCKF